jgi:CheY-like chemotaxis protein
LSPKKILIVDDYADARDALHLLLTLEGFEVSNAQNGQEALHILESEQPDLLITDINMFHGDGISLIQHLRRQPRFRNLFIVVVTAYRNLKQSVLEVGANEFFTKPVDFDELINAINRLLGL